MTEQANEATGLNRDMQDCIGKIEVVVLRCDDDGGSMVAPRAQAPLLASLVAKAPAKAPSAKAPSLEVPSVAASEGLGGLFGLFDGACDIESDDTSRDTSEDSSLTTSDGEHVEQMRSATEGRHEVPILGLDGHEYEQPGVVVNQYGQMMDPRTPYYPSSGARVPKNLDYNYDVNADTHHVPMKQRIPERRAAPQPRTFIGTDGRRYEILDRQQPSPEPHTYVPASQRPFTPMYQATTHARMGPQAHHQSEAIDHHAPLYDRPLYVDPTSEVQYTTHKDLMTQLDADPQRHIQQHPSFKKQIPYHIKPAAQESPMIDPEYQRYLIFQMPEKVEGLFEVDHKFVAEAVAHMPLLKTTPIFDLRFEEMQKLKRKLRKALDRGHWTNGIKVSVEYIRMRESRSRMRSPHSRSAVSGNKRDEKPQKQDDVGNITKWGFPTAHETGSKHGGKPKHNGLHDGRRSSGESQKGSSKDQISGQSGSTSDIWGDNAEAEAKGVEAEGGWAGDNGGGKIQSVKATGGWDDSNGGQEDSKGGGTRWETSDNTGNDQGAVNGWGPAAFEQTKPETTAPAHGDGAGPRTPAQHSPSSHHSRLSTSTNPHAYVQPYFQTWRGNGQAPATKPRPRQPREPYTYAAAPTPHMPADKVGDRSHGVRAGKGADYTHKTRRPKYMDTMDDPYAVFVFNYRSVDNLEEILRQNVSADMASVAEEVSRGVLMNLPRERLVEELMKSQARAPPKGENDQARRPEAIAAPKAKSTKAPSQKASSVRGWDTAPPAQGEAGQPDGFTPVENGGDMAGKAAIKDGWAPAGEGQTGGFGQAENNPLGGW